MKKLLSLLLVALMLLAVIPFAAVNAEANNEPAEVPAEEELIEEALIEEASEDKGEEKSISTTFCAPGTYVTFSVTSNSQWLEKDGYIESGNAGQSVTNAVLASESLRLSSDDSISFYYWYETEQDYDFFEFAVNGNVVLRRSGNCGGWSYYTYNIPSSGNYTFTFTYSKDDSNNYGSDCVRLKQFEVSAHKGYYIAQAATKAGCGTIALTDEAMINVATSTNSNHSEYIYTTNAGVASSTAKISGAFWLPEYTLGSYTFKFDYAFNAESYDKFIFKFDGQEVFRMSGNNHSNMDWHSYAHEVSSGGEHSFSLEYVKDSSVNSGADKLYLDNLELVASTEYIDRWNSLDRVNAANTQSQLRFNTPYGSTGFNLFYDFGTAGATLVSNNNGINSSTSFFETRLIMAPGEKLEFDYYVNSEAADKFKFIVNGATLINEGGWKNVGYTSTHYTFTAGYTGGYIFRWEYVKDVSAHRGFDRAMVSNIKYTGSYNDSLTLESVLSTTMTFYDSFNWCDGFTPFDIGSRTVAISRNSYYDYSCAELYGYALNTEPGDRLSFQFYLSAEINDKFNLYVDNQLVYTAPADMYGGWNDYLYHFETGGDHVILWEFAKNSTTSSGEDLLMLDYINVTRPTYDLDYINGSSTEQQLHFESTGSYPFVCRRDNSRFFARSTNQGVNNSESVMTSTATLAAGKTVSFDYRVSSESSYDILQFFVGTEEVFYASGNDSGTFTWTAPSSGTYTFYWRYDKDSSTHSGDDCAEIWNVCVGTGTYDLDNINGATTEQQLHFNTDGEYPFECHRDYDRFFARSTNQGVNASESVMWTTVTLTAGKTISFEYIISSETNYDVLQFIVNSQEVFDASGNDSGTYTWTAPSSGSYTIYWRYDKDNSQHVGDDCVEIWNVCVGSGGSTGIPGDTDGNGVVNMVDAVMALRHAMNLTTLNAQQLARADIDGNGTVNMIDAVTILRRSMGIS
ncbi:MAG: dockerin type I repeat-containing protein [Clostridia bacterium]|nr:dockerin type I repeat-containing protein [Clostridia bacterium]